MIAGTSGIQRQADAVSAPEPAGVGEQWDSVNDVLTDRDADRGPAGQDRGTGDARRRPASQRIVKFTLQ
jgi:hypothetical protein